MKYDPATHHRRTIRLQSFDYARTGAYFITICTQNRERLFGEIVAGQMQLNPAGGMISEALIALPERFSSVKMDTFVIMPNHIHWIIFIGNIPPHPPAIVEATLGVSQQQPTATSKTTNRATTRVAPTVGDMVGAFKSLTTVRYICGVKTKGWPAFSGKLWQRNYYEHVIRDDEELNRTRYYIETNPARWAQDSENPFRIKEKKNREDEYPWCRDCSMP